MMNDHGVEFLAQKAPKKPRKLIRLENALGFNSDANYESVENCCKSFLDDLDEIENICKSQNIRFLTVNCENDEIANYVNKYLQNNNITYLKPKNINS